MRNLDELDLLKLLIPELKHYMACNEQEHKEGLPHGVCLDYMYCEKHGLENEAPKDCSVFHMGPEEREAKYGSSCVWQEECIARIFVLDDSQAPRINEMMELVSNMKKSLGFTKAITDSLSKIWQLLYMIESNGYVIMLSPTIPKLEELSLWVKCACHSGSSDEFGYEPETYTVEQIDDIFKGIMRYLDPEDYNKSNVIGYNDGENDYEVTIKKIK